SLYVFASLRPLSCPLCSLSFSYACHRDLHSFPTRRSSDLARYLIRSHIPAPFRIHEKPPESKYADLLEFLKEFGLALPPWSKVVPGDFTRLLKKVRDRADATLLESVLLRSQSLAIYSPDNAGHFGLALEAYAHFTS